MARRSLNQMKPAFQKDEALLADIAAARNRKVPRIWWLGQSGFLLHAAERMILFDPYLSDSLTRKYVGTDKAHTRVTERVISPESLTGIDVITSSHNHTDHLDADTLRPVLAANPGAWLVVPRANVGFVLERLGPATAVKERLVPVDAGEAVRISGVEFTGIPSAHNEVETDAEGHCRFLGYVTRVNRFCIYHSGDTMMHPGLESALKRFSLDLVLLPINGNKPERKVAGNMDGVEAARLAKALSARLVIPHHYDMFEFNTVSPEAFETECLRLQQSFITLKNGEAADLDE